MSLVTRIKAAEGSNVDPKVIWVPKNNMIFTYTSPSCSKTSLKHCLQYTNFYLLPRHMHQRYLSESHLRLQQHHVTTIGRDLVEQGICIALPNSSRRSNNSSIKSSMIWKASGILTSKRTWRDSEIFPAFIPFYYASRWKTPECITRSYVGLLEWYYTCYARKKTLLRLRWPGNFPSLIQDARIKTV